MPRRRRSRRGGGEGKFDEDKHRRGQPGNKGQFASKPGSEGEGADGFKTLGIGKSDTIVVLREGFAARDGETVGSFLERLGYTGSDLAKGRRVLKAAHERGEIAFRAGTATAEPMKAVREPWPWPQTQRTAAPVEGGVRPGGEAAGRVLGLFEDGPAGLRFAQALNAGMPESMPIKTTVDGSGRTRRRAFVTVETSGTGDSIMTRSFGVEDGRLIANHDFFELDQEHRGGGHAKRMMRASVHLYDRVGVSEVRVTAGLTGGGYTWARYGFVPTTHDEATKFRKKVIERVGEQSAMPEVHKRAILDLTASTADDELPFAIAHYDGDGTDPTRGKQILLGMSWHGYIDLEDASHRERLRRALT